MDLENILLGLLLRPASGYDLKRAFDTAVNYFWRADIAQIYRTLGRMETKGLLKSKEVPSAQGPARKVYRRTAKGRKQLLAWLSEEPHFGPERATYVAQMVFMGEMNDLAETLRFLGQMRDAFTSRLAVLKHILVSEPESDPNCMTADDFHGYLGLQMGIQTTESRVKSCDWAIRTVKARIKELEHAP